MSPTLKPLLTFVRRAVVLQVGAIFFVAGTLGAVFSAKEWREALVFERGAIPAMATVVSTATEAASRDGNERTRYLVTYRVDLGGEELSEQTEEIPVDEWETLEPGSQLAVRYAPRDPGSVTSQPPRPRWEGPLLVGVMAAAALLGALLAIPGLGRLRIIWRIQRAGVEANARITEVGRSGTIINRVSQWRLSYEYLDRQGRAHTGRSELLEPSEAAGWHVDDEIAIRFDAARAEDSHWFGKRWA